MSPVLLSNNRISHLTRVFALAIHCHSVGLEKKMKSTNSDLIKQFKNCYILRNHQILLEDFWIQNGKIINPEEIFFTEKKKADIQIDCEGALICPGFIDIQINGTVFENEEILHTLCLATMQRGFGVDFSQGITPDGVEKVAKEILAHGVTAFCPTVVTSPPETYQRALSVIQKKEGGKHGAAVLGVHLEGPFINPEKKGAHSLNCIKTFDRGTNSLMDVYPSLKNVVLITLAPEIEGAVDITEWLTKKGIVVCLGHSEASLMQAEEAVKRGASVITHLFNAMLPFHHRDPGLVGLLACDSLKNGKSIYFGIIADGVHTHPTALRIAHKIHSKGLILVTDAISALGLQEGSHTIGEKCIEIRNGRAFILGTDTLCGSIATMNFSIKFFKEATGCSTVEALEAATLHPALALNIAEKKGTLNIGSDADFVLLTKNLDLLSTWIAGECVFRVPR